MVAEAGNIQVGQALAQAAIFDLAVLDINIVGYSISSVAKIIEGGACRFSLSPAMDQQADQKRSEHGRCFTSQS